MNQELTSISPLAAYISSFLNVSIPAGLLILLACALYWFFLLIPSVVLMEFMDRKLGADIQIRIGPNRVSSYGVFQFAADSIKLIFKQDASPECQEKWMFRWGTIAAIISVFVGVGSIPISESWILSGSDSSSVSILFLLALTNLFIFWASYAVRNEWSVISAFRSLSLISAYIVPVAIAMIPPIMISGSTSLDQIVKAQGGAPWRWNLFHDLGTLLSGFSLFVALLIWQSRVPFDHANASSEINGGIDAQYSGIRRGMTKFLEYSATFLAISLIVTCYLGGWRTPFNLESFGRAANLVEGLFFIAKVYSLVFIAIWIRWSLPRLRIDQIVDWSWKVLVPLSLGGVMISSLWIVILKGKGVGDFL